LVFSEVYVMMHGQKNIKLLGYCFSQSKPAANFETVTVLFLGSGSAFSPSSRLLHFQILMGCYSFSPWSRTFRNSKKISAS